MASARAGRGAEAADLLNRFYKDLFDSMGPQRWWPARTRFEMIVGAILTQNTGWTNVEKAVRRLKAGSVLRPAKMYELAPRELAALIRPAGYFNVKARRIKAFLDLLFDGYNGSIGKFFRLNTETLRSELLRVNGIGPETADSILLYAARRPVFVVDAYTRRLLFRHGLATYEESYGQIQALFMDNMEPDVSTFNEYHALIVRAGKEFCRPKRPLCEECPLGWHIDSRGGGPSGR